MLRIMGSVLMTIVILSVNILRATMLIIVILTNESH